VYPPGPTASGQALDLELETFEDLEHVQGPRTTLLA